MKNETNISKCLIFALNVGGMRQRHKQHHLNRFINIHKPDFMFICETNLNEKTNFMLPNYNIYRCDRGTNGGGTMLLSKTPMKRIKLEQRNLKVLK